MASLLVLLIKNIFSHRENKCMCGRVLHNILTSANSELGEGYPVMEWGYSSTRLQYRED